MNEIIGYIFIMIGLSFDIFGCIGLLRLPDIQAVTKCVTFGTCSILFGAFIIKGFSATGIKALMCMVFLILTAPVAAHALSRGAYISGIKLWDKSVCDKYAEEQPRPS